MTTILMIFKNSDKKNGDYVGVGLMLRKLFIANRYQYSAINAIIITGSIQDFFCTRKYELEIASEELHMFRAKR